MEWIQGGKFESNLIFKIKNTPKQKDLKWKKPDFKAKLWGYYNVC
jgi:hypothetical protein